MSNWPKVYNDTYASKDVIEMVETSAKGIRLLPVFDGDTISPHAHVIVECWDHKRYGRVRRAYFDEFNESERRKIGRLHTRARNWVMVRGMPQYVVMQLATYHLLCRAAAFFASH